MTNKNFKSMLCVAVFAIVSLHSLALHGHRHHCEAESHLHDIVHCEQLDSFIPAADTDSCTMPLICIVETAFDPAAGRMRELPDGRIPDEADRFVSREGPGSGGSGLRAPPVL